MKQEFEKNFVTEDQNQSKFNDNSIICTIGQVNLYIYIYIYIYIQYTHIYINIIKKKIIF